MTTQIILVRLGRDPEVRDIRPYKGIAEKLITGKAKRIRLTSRVDLWYNENSAAVCSPNRRVTIEPGYSQIIYGSFFLAARNSLRGLGTLSKQEITFWLEQVAQWPAATSSLSSEDFKVAKRRLTLH